MAAREHDSGPWRANMSRDEFFLRHWRPLPGGALTSGQVSLKYAVTRSQLRYWESVDIIRPKRFQRGRQQWRGFDPQEEATVRRLAYLLGEGMSLLGAGAKLPVLALREEAMRPVELPKPPVRWDDIFDDPPVAPLGS